MIAKFRPLFVWLASCLVALSPWAVSTLGSDATWASVATPANIFSLCGIIGGVTLALLGRSPLQR